MEAGLSRAEKKAILLAGGPVILPKDFHLPFKASRSTAGPGAGAVSIVFGFEGMRVKKAISREQGEFELHQTDDGLTMTHRLRPFLEHVEIKPTIYHSPEQAFINLHQECIYSCKFCTSPHLGKDVTKDLDMAKVRRMIRDVADRKDLCAVAITSAVVGTPEATVKEIVEVVRMVRNELGEDMPIGVEPYVSSLDQIDRLKEAGANEIKLNVETFDPAIFVKVCGEMDLDWIMLALEHAVRVFGRERVTSNIIFGLGESDEDLLKGVDRLAAMGIVATLRPLRLNDINRPSLEGVLGPLEPVTPERIIHLARESKRILANYGLSPTSYQTMCHLCRCCDIVPFADI
jgi:biotin synthase-related radical SAM superfamily protein